ncbi:MAG: TlpA family protein disulfide reductase [Planctomycetota bacterium]|nr:MAG: TlpA family protein disulfide reductase [Planctomycetota bacterium]
MEAPHLNRLQEKYRTRGLAVVVVDVSDQPTGVLRAYLREKKLTLTMLTQGSEYASRIGIPGTPTTLWIDRAGTITDVEVGFGGWGSLEKKTRRLLRSAPAADRGARPPGR